MHDAPLNQAVGLLGLAEPVAPQLLAVVAHGDARSEQPLLWQLSSALCELGYSVCVLDATMPESDDNPGLQQWLDFPFGHSPVAPQGPSWNVLPAATGLQSLSALGAKPQRSLQRLGQAFQNHGVVLVYADVDTLVRLLSDTDLRPLLSVSSEKSALLSSYLALKRLLRKGRLEPTILNMMQDDTQGSAGSLGVAGALRECARNFLAYEVHPIHIDPMQTETLFDADMRRLATRLLEHALPLTLGAPSAAAGFALQSHRPASAVHATSNAMLRVGELSRSH